MQLSVDHGNLFKEAALFWYEKTKNLNQEASFLHVQPENLVALKRGIFRASQYADIGKKLR